MFSASPPPTPPPIPIELVVGDIDKDFITQGDISGGRFLSKFLPSLKIDSPLTVVRVEGQGLNIRFWDSIQSDFEKQYKVSIVDYLKMTALHHVNLPLDSIVIWLYVNGGEVIFFRDRQYLIAERFITEEIRIKNIFVSPTVGSVRVSANSSQKVLAAIADFFRKNPSFKEGWTRKGNKVTIDGPILRVRVFTHKLASKGYEVIDFILLVKPIKGKEAIVSINASGSYVMVGRFPDIRDGDIGSIFVRNIKDEALLLYVHSVLIPSLSQYLSQKK
jgi:hypothetical protein